ncbi:MAG: hypothetical protein K1X88_01640 [Nannocystaceae bacterium]|nr:hypothetical protein [Nannocystaceae bacterium]
MSGLKAITAASIPRALEKAERYRLLNEPFFAESICLDVLAIDAHNQPALRTYVLALTDQFPGGEGDRVPRARKAIEGLSSEYERAYYTGIVAERRAVALLERHDYGAGPAAWGHLQEALRCYAQADALQTDDSNDDAVLRHNTCVRLIALHRLREPDDEPNHYPLE